MSFLANLAIPRKLLAAFAGVILVTLASSSLIYEKVVSTQQAEHWNAHCRQVLSSPELAMLAMVDQEAEQLSGK